MTRHDEDIAKRFKKSLPSTQQEQEAGKRVFYRLLLAQIESSAAALPHDDEIPAARRWRPRFLMSAAATAALASLLVVLLLTSGVWKTGEVLAHIEPSGDPIRSGESVRASSPESMIVVLRDGSQVEMRSQSELRIDRADDGLRVHLNNEGSIIVLAAKQGAGHLYVETNGANVSVVGTVFVVTAEQIGSRVGVIEGVVNVQQDAISQRLQPGQQLSTNPAMEPVPLSVEVSWSRYVSTYLALLQQSVPAEAKTAASAPPPLPAPPSAPPQTRPATASQQTAPAADSLLVTGSAGSGAPRAGRPTTPETQRAMEQALVSREPIPDLPFVAEINYFQSNRAEYLVPVTIEIPGSQLAGSASTKRIALDLLGRITDDYGTAVASFRDSVDVLLSDQTVKELPMRQIVYEAVFTLLPGRYTIKFLVHDVDTDRIGTYERVLLIPNLSRESNNLPISSVVLSSELLSPSANGPAAVGPLVVEGKKLIPNASGPFSNRRDLIVFLEAYEPSATATEPLTAFVTLYRGDTKVLETPPLTFKDDSGRKLRTLPVELRVPLTRVPAGEYDCQVTVLNPATQKTAVWLSRINVVN